MACCNKHLPGLVPFSVTSPFDVCSPPSHTQRLPRGVVLRHRLLARRLAGGRAPPRVPGAGSGAAGGQGGGGSCCGAGGRGRGGAAGELSSVHVTVQKRCARMNCHGQQCYLTLRTLSAMTVSARGRGRRHRGGDAAGTALGWRGGMSAISLHLKVVKLGKLQAGQMRAAWATSSRGTADARLRQRPA